MSLVAIAPVWMQSNPNLIAATYTSSVIDATGEQHAWVGRVWNKDQATKSITKVGFLPGTIVSAGGSGLRLSLQDPDLTTGNPARPDGTQDQTVDFLASALTSDTWYQTLALSASRSVAYGEPLAVVLEYDAGGRLGSDAVNVKSPARSGSTGVPPTVMQGLLTASWAAVAVVPNILLEFTDGTFGTLNGAVALATLGSDTFNSGSAFDEVALEFTVPFACKIDGAWLLMRAASATRNFDIVLYQGTTELVSVSIDAETLRSYAFEHMEVSFAPQTLAPATTYRLALRPTTTGSNELLWMTVAAAGHWQAHQVDLSWAYNTRVDAGAWGTADATKRPIGGLRFCAFDNGAGGGGGPHSYGFLFG